MTKEAAFLGWWILVLLVIVGHFSLHLTIYNRINATGLPRSVIKVLKYVFLGTCLLIPVAAGVWAWRSVPAAGDLGSLASRTPWPLALYAGLTLLTIAIYGPRWLLSRPGLNRDAIRVDRTERRVAVQQVTEETLARTFKCRWQSALPLNQIFELAIEHKEIPVAGLPPELDGIRLAHLSDIHLTGHVSPAFYRYVVEQACRWEPDLIAMTGDIVDKPKCVEWLDDCFGSAAAPQGCYFVLGNHDLRIKQPQIIRDRLQALGWRGLGGTDRRLAVRGVPVQLIGNEAPWFPSAVIPPGPDSESAFRILLSHSPDQIGWARARQIGLMLAGHTHGGQGRLPLVGPVLSPSYYGSRYASGTFYLAPTTMHVSRGLSGVHLVRICCPPELALLTLRSAAGRGEKKP